MGWTAYYQVLRDRELDRDELVQVAAFVRTVGAEPWDSEPFSLVAATAPRPSRVIARGWNKLGDESDLERVETAIDQLRSLLPDAEVRVADDFEALGTLAKLATDDDHDGWHSLLTLVPPPGPTLPASDDIAGIFAALDGAITYEVRSQLDALLDACDPDAVMKIGMRNYAKYDSNARAAVHRISAHVRDPHALVGRFLQLWNWSRGKYYYGDMCFAPTLMRVFASEDRVRARWRRDVEKVQNEPDSYDIVQRRAAAALKHLALEPAELPFLASVVRQQRAAGMPCMHELYYPALQALARAATAEHAATTLLGLDGRGTLGAMRDVIENAIIANPELGIPVIRALLASGHGETMPFTAIERAGVAAASLEDAVLPYLTFPERHRRAAARRALAALRGTPTVEEGDDVEHDPETLIVHPDLDVRHKALRAVHGRKDPSLFVALLYAEHVDRVLRNVFDWPALPFSWHDWKPIVPTEIANGRTPTLLQWSMKAGAEVIGPQRELAALTPLIGLSDEQLLARYPNVVFRLPPELRAQLEAAQ